ncbi:MAG: hypothetical protein ACR2JW_19095 [Thermomicrobiales bacterium]
MKLNIKAYGVFLLVIVLFNALLFALGKIFGIYALLGYILLAPFYMVVVVKRARRKQEAAKQALAEWHLVYLVLTEDQYGHRRYNTLVTHNTNRMPDASERVIIGPAIVGNDAMWYTTDAAALFGMISKYHIDPYDAGTWDGVWPRLGDRVPVYFP